MSLPAVTCPCRAIFRACLSSDIEQCASGLDQLVLRGVGMAFAGQLVQRVMQAGPQAVLRINFYAQVPGDLISLAKPNCEDILRQLIRIMFDDLAACCAPYSLMMRRAISWR